MFILFNTLFFVPEIIHTPSMEGFGLDSPVPL